MKELSFGDLKQGLICCTVYKNCSGCPLYMGSDLGPKEDCTYALMSAAFNCINTMERDIASIADLAKRWERQCLDREAEIFRFHEQNKTGEG